ncbi:MAG TPA: thioredoxin-like domain-containing protein [Isosphaeraceae bacterium]|nr:thioredoxin-like domain-containing protein [Isosphaeraceae bacterium]
MIRPAAFLQGVEQPSLGGGVGWLNTAGPIRLEELRGKIVLLDFWTYCCINCHHVLPALATLEKKYKDDLVVIGVHTPKFFAEQDTEGLRKKVREYGIKHPIINDAEQRIWHRFGVESWPTLVVLGPRGEPIARQSGEVPFEALDRDIGQLVERYRARGDLNGTPIKFFPEDEKPDDTPLLFPGKVLADAAGKRLFVSDTGHNRIVMAGLAGQDPKPIGDGRAGLVGGDFVKAEFNRPQGMCLVGETLYVADTENHALRAVDLVARTVATVAGTGRQSQNFDAHGPGTRTSLTSPWDVVHVPGTNALLIAMAGQHQIWRYDLGSKQVGAWAGTGREDVGDGPLGSAAFAQPSGLATDGQHLFVADSEGSAIRSVSFARKGARVSTLAGTHDLPQGQSLFAFDDIDGRAGEARLQHCLGVAYAHGRLYIADTYNNKIKVYDPKTRSVKTLVGSHEPGDSDKPPRFDQPGGLSVAGSTLYVADTGNHKVRTVDLNASTVATLDFGGLKPPAPPARAPSFPNASVVAVPTVKVAPGEKITLEVMIHLAPGFKLNTGAAMPYLVETPGKSGVLADSASPTGQKLESPRPEFTIDVPLARPAEPGRSIPLKLSLSAFVCNEGSSLCTVKSYVWNIPIAFADGGKEKVTLTTAVH